MHNPGLPIPSEAQAQIFDKFYRLAGRAGDGRGTGLGLAICKGSAEAHGGRIWTRNEQGGVGFYVALPLGLEALPGRTASV
jgi:signal transduction histidine kinase